MPGAKHFFTSEQKDAIVAAIREAEKNTSGEIRVHLEEHNKKPVLERAKKLFHVLKMDRTDLHNGVLFYLAIKDHQFAIYGDSGINEKVPENFWDGIKEVMEKEFREDNFTEGLTTGIRMAGQQLQAHFPRNKDIGNELTDEISFKDDQ